MHEPHVHTRLLLGAAVVLGSMSVAACVAPVPQPSLPTTAPTTSSTIASTIPTTPGRSSGPRPLADSVVPLEVDAFPGLEDGSCSGQRRSVVHVGDSIGAAIAAAAPDTTIVVDPGTYVEQPDESVALDWATPGLCVMSSGPDRVVLQAALGQSYGINIVGDRTVLRGIDLRGFQSGIGMNATDGRTQRAVTIEDVTISNLTGPQRDGIVAYGDNRSSPGTPPTVDGLLLHNVRVEGSDLGISCNAGPCAHWWIEGSVVSGRPTAEDSGADGIAVEEGRQIAVVDSTVSGAAADGIDTKADDVVVTHVRVQDVKRNGIKLWRGGDVIDSVVDGTNADASLVGDRAGRYRYLRTTVTHHGDPGATQYVGTWGYDHPGETGMRLEITDCTFVANASGGLYAPVTAQIWFERDRFADTGTKLLELSDGTVWMADPTDLAALETRGFGRDNRIGAG